MLLLIGKMVIAPSAASSWWRTCNQIYQSSVNSKNAANFEQILFGNHFTEILASQVSCPQER